MNARRRKSSVRRADRTSPTSDVTTKAGGSEGGASSGEPGQMFLGSSVWAARIGGLGFLILFAGLARGSSGLRIEYASSFSIISQGEFMLWIGHALLLLPGALLLGFGLSSYLGRVLRWLVARCEAFNGRSLVFAVIVLVVAGTGVARLGNALVFHGYPVTDDEYAVKFGGQVLASGVLTVPVPDFVAAMPTRYFYFRDGAMTSMDWLGPQLVWAVSELTGTGNLVWALLAGIGWVATGVSAGRMFGRRWALVAMAFFAMSPMALALSMSTHAHTASRAFFAIAIACLVEAIRREDNGTWWGAFGFALSVSFICRPFETGFLALPIAINLLWRGIRRQPASVRTIAAVLAGAAAPILLFALHSWLLTGNPLTPPRFAEGASIPEGLPVSTTLERFGDGVAFNALMLAVWFLGPLGVALATLGAWSSRVTRLLSFGVISLLGLGLLHDNFGIHTVGPIHYSECAVPLTLIATQGLVVVRDWLARHSLSFDPIASALLVSLVVGLGTFNAVTFAGIRRQAEIQSAIYERVESAREFGPRTIVLAPQFATVWRNDERFAATGSWVFDWRRPHPDYDDPVIVLHDDPDVTPTLRERFPDRALLRLVLPVSGSDFELIPDAGDVQVEEP